jgi:hypothetical protein
MDIVLDGGLGPQNPPDLPGPLGTLGSQGKPSVNVDEGDKATTTEGEGMQQLQEVLRTLAERVLTLEHMVGIYDSLRGLRSGRHPKSQSQNEAGWPTTRWCPCCPLGSNPVPKSSDQVRGRK